MEDDFLPKIYGYSKVKEELKSIRDLYLNYKNLGEKRKLLPRGIVICAQSGNGKTLLAEEYAKTFGYPVFSLPKDEYADTKSLMELFIAARQQRNGIIVFDDLDELLSNVEGAEEIISRQLDLIDWKQNIFVIATIVSHKDISERLFKQGRLDRRIVLDPYDFDNFEKIISGLSKDYGILFAKDECAEIANNMKDASVDDIKKVLSRCSLLYDDKCSIDDFFEAADLVLNGYVNEFEKRPTPYYVAMHEAGHAIYLLNYVKCKELIRVNFDGHDGGKTIYRKIKENLETEDYIEMIRCSLAGLVTEDVFFHNHGIGCREDINKATRITYELISHKSFGKPDYLIPDKISSDENGRSEFLLSVLDKRTSRFLKKNYRVAKRRIIKHKGEILSLADYLAKNNGAKREEIMNVLSNN